MATFNGTTGPDLLAGGAEDDIFTGGLGIDTITGADGADTAIFNVSTDGADLVNLGAGLDKATITAAGAGQVRLTFTSAEVGNNSANDAGTGVNQDGGLAVRMQFEGANDTLTGDISRWDDEGVTFTAATPGLTFDVRDLVSGAARGDQFRTVTLGANLADTFAGTAEADYINAGQGADTVTGGLGADFLVGGAGDDNLDGGDGNDSFIGGAGADVITGGDGDDTVIFNLSTDGADRVNLGAGADKATISAAGGGQIRLTFTSAEVGNNSATDAGTGANQDGGLAVRMQLEGGVDALGGDIARFDDEGITFTAATAGLTFDVRDLVSGAARGDQFRTVALGTNLADTFTGAGEADYINAGAGNDTVTGGAGADFLVGGGGDDTLDGGADGDSFIGGGGNDSIVGGAGDDVVIYTGARSDYRIDRMANGATRVTDIRTAATDGVDTVFGVERFTFSGGTVSEAALYAGTTSVATLSYQFFTGKTPTAAGYDYLTNSTVNQNDLNDPYYAQFNVENRFINFAVNLGKLGEGAAKFQADYGGLSLADATAKAYTAIFGAAPAAGKVAEILSSQVAPNVTRADYFAAYGLDGANGIGTKAAAVGFLLVEAQKAGIGPYASANANFLADVSDGGALYNVDLLTAYATPVQTAGAPSGLMDGDFV
jgi:Ca2+-binding RTX toxin-like protein